jgi:hypothetical protein
MIIQGYFLETYNEGIKESEVAPKKITLLIDYDSHDKFMRVTNNLAGEHAKTSIVRRGGDILLTVNVSNIAEYTLGGDASSIRELLGREINVNLKVQRYTLTSKYEKNYGEKIAGVTAKLMSASASF